ncbi:MAG: TetR/AcrR family transcriptional regulator [Anaerolineae bacterium]|nr:TetR/AcrR family transcriptional regulator [Anaerolineae bacterium]
MDIDSLRERKKQRNRTCILNAALHLFQTQGFDTTTVDAIAEAAEVSRSTFFNYFPTKESLLNEIAAEELQGLEEQVALKMAQEPSAVAKIRYVMRTLAGDTVAFLQLTRYILIEAMLHPTTTPSPNIHLDSLLHPLVQQAQILGEIRADLDPHQVTGAIIGIYLHAFFRWISEEGNFTPEAATEVETTVDMLFEGIAESEYRR